MDLITNHIQRNSITADQWHSFAHHRQQIMGVISKTTTPTSDQSICIVGAGNANDLEPAILADWFHSIALVDLDGQALQRAQELFVQQVPSIGARLTTHSDVDVSQAIPWISKLRPASNREDIDAAIWRAANPPAPTVILPADVVVSTCLLTQLFDNAVKTLGNQHPRLADLILAIRDGHFHLLNRLTKPNGFSILITDLVSSDTLPDLKSVADERFEDLVYQAINQQNFFTGTNPVAIRNRFVALIGDRQIGLTPPWKWTMGDRVYACCAFAVKQAPE